MIQIKLSFNIFDQDLAYRFGVHQSIVSRLIKQGVTIMYIHLKPLIKWPEHELLLKTMPEFFKRGFDEMCV